MSKFINYVIFILFILLGLISKILTKSLRTRYGNLIGDFMRFLSPRRRKITSDNINHAFPEKSSYECFKILKNSYRNLGITMTELLAFPIITKNENLEKYIKFENIELIEEVLSRGKGALLLSGHFGNWELMAYACGKKLNKRVLIPVKNQKNNFIDKILNKYRTDGGNEVVSMDHAARKMIVTLKNEGIVAMLADQSATANKDVFVNFFGRPAATYEAPASIALRLEIPMIIGFSKRLENGSYSIRVDELDYKDILNSNLEIKNKIQILTERHVKVLEDIIRIYPGLWSWQHRRWKHSPV